jgi:paraquat-inducible protein A
LPDPGVAERASCARCDALVWDPLGREARRRWTGAFALAALVLYPVGISLPIMQLERFGHQVDASVWSGSIGMLRSGELWIGSVVLLCSVVLPLTKLAALCALVWGRPNLTRKTRARTYRLVEWAGRWGMLDVLLVAVVVAWVKIGDLVEVRPGPAALAFTTCVVASLCASAAFDPHALWEEDSVHVE